MPTTVCLEIASKGTKEIIRPKATLTEQEKHLCFWCVKLNLCNFCGWINKVWFGQQRMLADKTPTTETAAISHDPRNQELKYLPER